MGRFSAGGETYSEMPNSPQGLNRHHKASPRDWEIRYQQVLCHLTCRQLCSLLDWTCQTKSGKLFVFVLHSAMCARVQKRELCRYPLSMPKHNQNNHQMVVKVTHKRNPERHAKQAKIKLLSHRERDDSKRLH